MPRPLSSAWIEHHRPICQTILDEARREIIADPEAMRHFRCPVVINGVLTNDPIPEGPDNLVAGAHFITALTREQLLAISAHDLAVYVIEAQSVCPVEPGEDWPVRPGGR